MARDALDRLRDVDPLRDRDLPDAHDPAPRSLREAVLAGGATSPDRARRRRWVAAGGAAAAVLAAAAALAVTTSGVEDPTSVGCYTGATTQASTVVVADGPGGPVATCAALWAEGVLDPAVTTADAVPVLVPCVLEEGVVGVFPAGSCDDVTAAPGTPPTASEGTRPTGLPLPDHDTDDEATRQAMEQIRQALLDRCLSLDAATVVAEEALAEHDLEGWTIGSVLDDHPDGTCAGFFPDASERAVRFVPDEPEPGQTPEG